jgi:hypothetical protein
VPGVVTNSDEEFGTPARVPKKEKSKSTGAGTPVAVVAAMACVGVLMLLNLWELASNDEFVWKIIAVLRLFVEGRVLWGLRERQDQTALTATVAAGMMTLISLFMLYLLFTDPDLKMEMTPSELTAGRVFFIVQTLAEIGAIVGINLPVSKSFLSRKS